MAVPPRPGSPGDPICSRCEGQGRVRVFVQELRRRAFRPCTPCGGTGHIGPVPTYNPKAKAL